MRSRRRTSVRVTPRPRPSIPAGHVKQLGDGQWEIRINRDLKSPNRTGLSWVKRREREEWLRALEGAAAVYAGVTTAAGLAIVKRSLSLFVQPGVLERRRVVIERHVPSLRRFIRDDDNLAFAPKQLLDSMKVAGLISEDRREYLDAPRPTQHVSPDGEFWVVIRIERLAVGEAARPTRRRTTPPPPAAAGGLL